MDSSAIIWALIIALAAFDVWAYLRLKSIGEKRAEKSRGSLERIKEDAGRGMNLHEEFVSHRTMQMGLPKKGRGKKSGSKKRG